MSVVKYVGIIFLCGISSFALSGTTTDEIKLAQDQVTEYKTLRSECAAAQGTERKMCFSELHAATEDYRKAKKVLASHKSKRGYILADQGR